MKKSKIITEYARDRAKWRGIIHVANPSSRENILEEKEISGTYS